MDSGLTLEEFAVGPAATPVLVVHPGQLAGVSVVVCDGHVNEELLGVCMNEAAVAAADRCRLIRIFRIKHSELSLCRALWLALALTGTRTRLSATCAPSNAPGANTVANTKTSRGGSGMQFRGTVQLDGKTATGIRVPEEIVTALGGGNRPIVRVALAGYSYQTTVAQMRGEFVLPVSAAVREQAGVAAGDEVEVGIDLDTAPCELDVPAELAAALEHDAP
jgi:hypothetical protein